MEKSKIQKTLKESKKETLELKNLVSEMKNSLADLKADLNSRRKIQWIEDRPLEIIEAKEQKKKKKEKQTTFKGLVGTPLRGPTYASWESQKEMRDRKG